MIIENHMSFHLFLIKNIDKYDIMGSDAPFSEPFYGSEKEKCVSCGKVTEYKITDHIDARENYVEGAGQLCSECYKEIYNEK